MLQIELVPITAIKPYENNAKIHTQEQIEQIKKSILEFGNNDPIAVDADGVIIEGHGRLMALQELGYKEVEIIRLDHLSEEQRKAYTLIHNKLTMNTGFDLDILAGELEDIQGIDMSDYDFTFDMSGEDVLVDEPHEDNYEPEIPTEPRAKLGQVWQLGEHRVMCGDSTDADMVSKLMAGQRADIEFTSPPYNAGASEKLSGNTHTTDSKYLNNNDDLDNYDELLFKSTENGIRFAKYAIINLQMLAGNKAVFCEYMHKFKEKLCDIGIWVKTTTAPAMAERVMNSQFEFVFFFSADNNSRAVGTNNFRGTVSNVFECSPQRKNEFSNIHAATFSIEFASHYINNFSKKKDSVLDLFGGTGTTLIACEQLGRRCYMMELDPRYVDVIIDRWEQYTGQKAKLLTE